MDELTRVLWDYACQCRLDGCYDLQTKAAREEEEELAGRNRAHLEESGAEKDALESLWDGLELIRAMDMEAAFVCGLRLGLSLFKEG